ncbi:MAG: hypothetical protein ABL903_20345 [Methylococcales bacterium]
MRRAVARRNNANVNVPLTHLAVGVCSPFERGQKMTALLAVFLCPPFSTALSCAYFVMAVCIGRPLRSAAPRCGTANLIQSVARCFAASRGGLSSLTRIHRMTTNTPRAKSAQNIKSAVPAITLKFCGFGVSL